MTNIARIRSLERGETLSHADWVALLSTDTASDRAYARARAQAIAFTHFGRRIYTRGLIEFTNHCKQDCLYCGIRRSNGSLLRYRLTEREILQCCMEGHALGCRTFVLQGGEDAHWTDARLTQLISSIKRQHPDCAVTLSLGERSRQSYERLFQAGAARYLLRHETADAGHFGKLHPASQTLETRMRCLHDLREIGYQTGCGMMIGTPHQTPETLAADMEFIAAFQPHMVGVGPFIPHKDTPLGAAPLGSVSRCLFVLSLLRILLPEVLLPATTALGTAQQDGHLQGMDCGCNVVMPNLTPGSMRNHYQLYDGKIGTQDCPEDSIQLLQAQLARHHYELVVSRGDYADRRHAL